MDDIFIQVRKIEKEYDRTKLHKNFVLNKSKYVNQSKIRSSLSRSLNRDKREKDKQRIRDQEMQIMDDYGQNPLNDTQYSTINSDLFKNKIIGN